MQNDKGQNKLFIFGILCLGISLACILYSLYILPFLIWRLSYEVSDTVLNLIAIFEDDYYYTPAVSRLLTWLVFFVPGAIAGVLSWYFSRKIDKKVLGLETEETTLEEKPEVQAQRFNRDMRESAGLGMKIIVLMLCVFGLFAIVQLIL